MYVLVVVWPSEPHLPGPRYGVYILFVHDEDEAGRDQIQLTGHVFIAQYTY